MAGMLDFLATALPHSVFANLQNASLQKGMMDSANEGIWGTPGFINITPKVGTLPGEQPQSGGASSNPFNYSQYPKVKNPDGSESNVVTKSFNIDGKETLLPTMVGGQRLTDQQAIDNYKKTGRHFGQFATPEEADAAAGKLEASMQQPLAEGLNSGLAQNTQPRGWDASLSPDRAQAYASSLPKPGLLDAVPQQQRPFIEGMAKAMGPDVAAKAAYESNVQKPMTAYESANLAQQGSKPVFAPDGETGYAKGPDGAYQPVIKGAPKPPSSRNITRGLDTVTQEFDPTIGQYKDISTGPRQLPPQSKLLTQEEFDQQVQLKKEEAALQVDPQAVDSEAERISNYDAPYPSGFVLRTPFGQALSKAITEKNPTYDSKEFTGRSAAKRLFFTKNADAVRFAGVAVQHMDILSKAVEALDNGDAQVLNSLSNEWQRQTGSPLPTNVDAIRNVVGGEVTRAVQGAPGALADREEYRGTLRTASSMRQMGGVINSYRALLGGQLGGLRKQYESTTGAKDFDRFITEQTALALPGSGGSQGGGGGAPPPDAAPPLIKTKTEFDALQKGALYKEVDGNTYRK